MTTEKAIGGYFELELTQGFPEKYPNALKYQSARAAFLALLQPLQKIKRVWMPYYICDSMLAPIHAAGKEIAFYSINEWFAIKDRIPLEDGDLLLYVNYFGVCDGNVATVLTQYDPAQVVIDCSQAFYSGPFECLATIYSPRKFFGLPDGGLLITSQALEPPSAQDHDSLKRCAHLLARLAFSAEEGYESYKAAESSLDDLTPKVMSQLTQRMLTTIDYSATAEQRSENFAFLHKELGSSNRISLVLSKNSPLCYPYLTKRKINKKKLAEKRIFIPAYWPDVLRRNLKDCFELTAADQILAIPCDQRYRPPDLNRIVSALKNDLHP